MPGFSLSLGLIMLVAFWTGDKPGDGLMALGVMTAVAALGAVGGLAYIVIVAALRRRG